MAAPGSRPIAAMILSLIGGIFILIGGIFFTFLLGGGSFFGLFGVVGLVFGILVIVGAVMLYNQPSQHTTWGVIVLVFSISSIVSLGGFLVGLILGTIGGALAIAWQPFGTQPPPAATPGYFVGPYGVPVMPWRMCMGCGRSIPWAYNVCPLCGTQTPLPPWAGGTGPAPAPAHRIGPAAMAPAAPMPAPMRPPAPVAAPAPEPVFAPCPTCDQKAEWMPNLRRWFCRAETRYF